MNAADWKMGRPAIIVSNNANNQHSPVVEMVYLTTQDKNPLPTHVSIPAKYPSTALCENIYTVPKDRLSSFIRSCTPEEMRRINQALICSLALSHHGEVTIKSAEATADTVQLQAELNVYKQLYNDLLQKTMKEGLL